MLIDAIVLWKAFGVLVIVNVLGVKLEMSWVGGPGSMVEQASPETQGTQCTI